MRCPPDEVLLHALDAAVRNGPAGAGAARGWQCRVNSGGRVRMSGTAHRARCSLARRRRPRSPATRLAPAWLSRKRSASPIMACERLDVNGVFPPHHSLKPAHKGTTRWVGSSPVDTCDRCLFVCAGANTEEREVWVVRRDVARSRHLGHRAPWWRLRGRLERRAGTHRARTRLPAGLSGAMVEGLTSTTRSVCILEF